MNAREQLAAIADWLGWQEESLSFGLKNSMDALRLYDYAQAHPDLPEMADGWKPRSLIAALGYNPFEQKEAIHGREVGKPGTMKAVWKIDKYEATVMVLRPHSGDADLMEVEGVWGRSWARACDLIF